ncbi:PREDICTED: probable disease resistance protein RPP1 [Prunus mume]|uniref:Probable disease resistance protein RPP1 n=1 Tax=Prunus mume TaxID=102107 RepID=A0ABM0NDV1_PRUMU|nr:PREDICTED: probable disease resistance protein RPP1 [Prunus mume]
MDSIEFFQVFIIIIMTLFCLYFRSLTSSSSSTSSVAAVDTDIPHLQEKYDVFISFRGDETRDSFTSHLHKALLRKNIETYVDDKLEKGDDIGPALLEAIGRSKIALVIFSKDYSSSTWCLKELVHILRCKKNHGKIVIPIFYRVDPSDVRKQKGTYALEGHQLKKRFKGIGDEDEVANWRAALEEAANMSGFHYSSKTGRTEADVVEQVVQDVLIKLNMSTKPKNNTERGEAKRGDAFNISGNTIEGSNSGRVGIFEFGSKNVYKGHEKEKQVDSRSGETDSASGGENEE